MNIKSVILSAAALLLPTLVSAGPVSEEEARREAESFLASRVASGQRRAQSAISRELTVAIKNPSYYLFNVGKGNGFVLMSASDRTRQVLGYADSGRIDADNMPDQLRAWLDKLSEVVAAADNGTIKRAQSGARAVASTAAGSTTKNFVPTLVPSRWNQGDPYNQQCPKYNNNGNYVLPATGCVATAMSQVMYFWKWPKKQCASIPGYTSGWNNTTTTYPALPGVTFDWDHMTDTYSDASSQTSKDAVAQLMHYVGRSIQMGYGPASGASSGNCVTALKNYYGYNVNMYLASSSDYTYQQWEDLIYNELAAGRPVLMAGDTSDRTGGHEWVCDGYDGNGLFHMNWGWGGMCDGYFILTVMFPDQQGIGGSTSSDGYSMGQNIVVGLYPAYTPQTPDPERVRCSVFDIRPEQTHYTRRSVTGSFSININVAFGTNLSAGYTFETAMTLYDANGNILNPRVSGASFTLNPGTYYPTWGCSGLLGSGLKDGVYYLKWRSRKKGDKDWNMCDSGEKNYVKAEIRNGTDLYLTVMPEYDLTVNSLTFEGSGTVGSQQKVKAVMTNNTDEEYYHDTYLLIDGKWVSGNCIQVPAHATRDIYFKYTPDTEGSHTAQLSTSKNADDAFYTGTLNVTAATANSLDVSVKSITPHTWSGSTELVYGNSMLFEVTIKNTATTPYKSFVKSSSWELSGNYFWQRAVQQQDVSIEPGETKVLTFEYTGLNYGSRYDFHVDTDQAASANLANYTFNKGIYMWRSDGTKSVVPFTGGQTFGPDVVALYFPGKRVGVTIAPSGEVNKNLTVFYDEGATVTANTLSTMQGITSNIVRGTKADQIVLYGDEAYHFPQSFTASEIKYVRPAAINTAAVMPLTLPFAPQAATADGQAVERFTSFTDAGKDYAISEFTYVSGTNLTFDMSPDLHAGRPSLLALAGQCGDSKFDIRGKELILTATDAEVVASGTASTYSTDYKYVGTSTAAALSDVYVLSADGTRFVRTASATVLPFSAYFVANNAEAAAATELTINSSIVSGIGKVSADDIADGTPVYDLSGVRVATYSSARGLSALPSGVYIIGGKKVVK